MSHAARREETRVESRPHRFLLALIPLVLPAAVLAQSITEYSIPTPASNPNAITAGGDGALWFTEKAAHKIGRITVQGQVTEFDLPSDADDPIDIAAGSDGNLWYASGWSLCRVTPAGAVSCQMVGLYGPLKQVVSGPDGALWFTAESHRIGRALPGGGVSFFSGSGVGDLSRIGFGPDHNLWYSTQTGDWVVRMTTSSGETKNFPLPHPGARNGVAAGPDGALWFGDDTGVLRLTPPDATGRWTSNTFETGPATDIAFDRQGNLWYTGGDGLVGRLAPGGALDRFGAGSAGRITAGPDGNMWFVEPSANKIGRVTTSGTVASLCVPDAHTLCLNDARFSVTAAFQLSPEGPTIQATAVRMTADTGYFWFFDDTNVELVAKVLNACGLSSPAYWFFASGLTNLGVTIEVTDLFSEEQRTYTNPIGTPFIPIQDTGAFRTCP